ncbi:hypothetical protein F4678DRAFT_414278 [Xylaria arbuscula]|nr:hypothetical protein F4678DRAFT_414278 [Xylaria arbuscula]
MQKNSFNRDQSQWPMTFALRPPQYGTTPRRWWHHYYYRGPQGQSVQVLYSKTKSHSETIARQFIDEPVLGFDMEWPWDADKRSRLQDKVALIQIASERKVALFHIALHKGETTDDLIAPSLKKIIESSAVIKAGVAVMNADFQRLKQHFCLEPKGAFELSHLHSLITYDASSPKRVTTRLHSLSMQVKQHLGLALWKGNVRTSDWSQPLNPDQTQYAATDAYAGFMLFHCMNAKRLAMDPVPPFPVPAETYRSLSISGSKAIQLEMITEDGEIRFTSTDEFFAVENNIEKEEEGTEEIESTESTNGGEKGDSNETDPVMQEVNDATGESQDSKIEMKSTHNQPGKGRNQTRIRERRPRGDDKEAGNDSGPTLMDGSSWALYGRLASHRKNIAKSQGISAFIIAHNTLLQALATRRPSNNQELLRVPGVGKVKARDYGPSWLEIIVAFEKERKRDDDPDIKQEADNQTERGGVIPRSADKDPKRRRIVRVGRSMEIVMPSDKAPAVLSTCMSFHFGEITLVDKPAILPQTKEQDDSDDDDAAFGPPMQPPSPTALKRKRELTTMPSYESQQRNPLQSATNQERVLYSIISPETAIETKSAAHIDPNPPVISAPVPLPIPTTMPVPASTASKTHLQRPPAHLSKERILLRNKMEAYVKAVVWAMDPKPTGPLLSEDTLRYLITALPRTAEEFHRVPGMQQFTKACEAVKMDIWRTFEKWVQTAGLVPSVRISR